MGRRLSYLLYAALALYSIAILVRYASGYQVLPTAGQFAGFVLYVIGARLLFIVTLALAAFGAGGAVFGRWLPRFSSSLEEGLFKSFTGLVVISYAVFAAGHVGLLYPIAGYIVIAGGLAAGWRGIPDYVRRVSMAPRNIRVGISLLILISLSAYFLVAGLHGSLLPPIGFDVLMYHFGVPKLYIGVHRIFPTPGINGSTFPFGIEMLYLLAMLVDGPISANLVNYAFIVAGGLAAAAFTRRFLKGAPLLAFAMYISMPMVVWLMPQAYTDLAQAAYTMLAVYALFAHFREDDQSWLVVSAVMAGFTVATKLSGVFVVGALMFLLILHYILAEKKNAGVVLRRVGKFMLLAAVVSAPWFIWNIVFYGNPVYPFLPGLFGHAAASGAALPPNEFPDSWSLVSSIWRSTFDAESFKMGAINGLGPVFLMFIPGILLFIKDMEREVKYLAPLCFVLFLVLLLLNKNIRYVAPIFPALAVLAAYPAGRLMRSEGLVPRMCGVLLVCVFAFGALLSNTAREAVTDFPSASREATDRYYSEGPWSGYLASYDAWKWINAELPPDAVIYQLWDDASVYFRERKTLGAALSRGDEGRQKVHHIVGYSQFGGYLPGREMLGNLRAMGAGYLLINGNREGHQLPSDPDFLANSELIYSGKGVFLYRLKP